jgi:hypothetical protein
MRRLTWEATAAIWEATAATWEATAATWVASAAEGWATWEAASMVVAVDMEVATVDLRLRSLLT